MKIRRLKNGFMAGLKVADYWTGANRKSVFGIAGDEIGSA